MRRRLFLGATVGLFALAALAAAVGTGVAAEEAAGPPPALTARVDTTVAPVGGAVDLTVEVGEAEGWLVDPPTKELDLEPFRVRTVERLERAEGAAWRLRLVPLSPGELEIPPVRLVARGPGGAVDTVAAAAIPMTVASNLTEDEDAALESAAAAPPAPPAPTPADPADAAPDSAAAGAPERSAYKPALDAPRDWVPLIVATAALLLAAAVATWILRKLRARKAQEEGVAPRAPRVPARPAWEIAREGLDRIAEAAYPERGEIDRQYVEVTEVLRRYLEDRYGVPALESTTEELRERFRRSPVRPEIQTRVLALLREADFVKFAKARPAAADARALEPTARGIVDDTTPAGPREEAA